MDEITLRRLKQLNLISQSEYSLDDITFEDLNLNEVFEKINKTSSTIGEEVLYTMLRQPLLNIEKINERKSIYENLSLDSSKSELLQKQLKKLPKLKKISVFEYLCFLGKIETIKLPKLLFPTLLILICIAIIPFLPPLGVILLVLVYFINAISYFKLRDKVTPYLVSVSYLAKTVKAGQSIPFIDKTRLGRISYLKNGAFLLGIVSGETVNGGSGNPLDVIIDIFKMGFHIDLIKFYSLIDRVKKDYKDIFEFMYEIGYLDALNSTISLSENTCESKFVKDSDELTIIEGYHPLIENAVSNSVKNLSKNVLLTGSNASGKSTFLRMVAVNAVLSQSILKCFAKEYQAPVFRIISSISVRDDLLKGESFYMAEVKALKRIIDLCDEEGPKVLCFVDEVLNGTNTYERIKAATSILKYLGSKSMCFAATHDIELTSSLSGIFENYHFREDIKDNDIFFGYKLNEGIAQSQNAIKLLEVMGFPKEILPS